MEAPFSAERLRFDLADVAGDANHSKLPSIFSWSSSFPHTRYLTLPCALGSYARGSKPRPTLYMRLTSFSSTGSRKTTSRTSDGSLARSASTASSVSFTAHGRKAATLTIPGPLQLPLGSTGTL